jgi:hypothetical protein
MPGFAVSAVARFVARFFVPRLFELRYESQVEVGSGGAL